jgi:pectate lyase
MDTGHHIWIDHCTFHDINDGMIDSRKDNTYLTAPGTSCPTTTRRSASVRTGTSPSRRRSLAQIEMVDRARAAVASGAGGRALRR